MFFEFFIFNVIFIFIIIISTQTKKKTNIIFSANQSQRIGKREEKKT